MQWSWFYRTVAFTITIALEFSWTKMHAKLYNHVFSVGNKGEGCIIFWQFYEEPNYFSEFVNAKLNLWKCKDSGSTEVQYFVDCWTTQDLIWLCKNLDHSFWRVTWCSAQKMASQRPKMLFPCATWNSEWIINRLHSFRYILHACPVCCKSEINWFFC